VDDVTLLAEMLETLVAGLLVLQDEAAPLSLQVNWTKTKIQHVILRCDLHFFNFFICIQFNIYFSCLPFSVNKDVRITSSRSLRVIVHVKFTRK